MMGLPEPSLFAIFACCNLIYFYSYYCLRSVDACQFCDDKFFANEFFFVSLVLISIQNFPSDLFSRKFLFAKVVKINNAGENK